MSPDKIRRSKIPEQGEVPPSRRMRWTRPALGQMHQAYRGRCHREIDSNMSHQMGVRNCRPATVVCVAASGRHPGAAHLGKPADAEFPVSTISVDGCLSLRVKRGVHWVEPGSYSSST